MFKEDICNDISTDISSDITDDILNNNSSNISRNCKVRIIHTKSTAPFNDKCALSLEGCVALKYKTHYYQRLSGQYALY